MITFGLNEHSFGTMNPTYSFDNIPIYGAINLSFGSHFVGQIAETTMSQLLDASPEGPLRLNTQGPDVATAADRTSIVLGGIVQGMATDAHFTTPIAFLFDKPVAAVCFDAGSFDHENTVVFEPFDSDGNSLESVNNTLSGYEHVRLGDLRDVNAISGVSMYVEEGSMDWEGFALDNVSFGIVEDDSGVIPEPGTMVIWALLSGLGYVICRKDRSH